ncbi:MAG: hypothetical protein RLZZ590_246 [Actinomycetota bacterium]|jgi:allophanate hydrolase
MTADLIALAVVGAHLSGQPLNHQLVDLNAKFVASMQTANDYRLFALETVPPKPGLQRVPDGAGVAIDVEVWKLPAKEFGIFVAGLPQPMAIGKIVLSDGSAVSGFLCESIATDEALDISSFGGWRAYLSSLDAVTP